jgi:hypothetical protein
MKNTLFWGGGVLCVAGFLLPRSGPSNAIGTICSLLGLGLVLYSLVGMRSTNPPPSGKPEERGKKEV